MSGRRALGTARGVLCLVIPIVFVAGMTAAAFQRQMGRRGESWDRVPYNGRFTFSRVRYGGGGFRGGSSWAHDYPRADEHLSRLMEALTSLRPNTAPTNVLDLEDPDIFRHPLLYVSEPGFWRISAAAAENLRAFLQKGGFIMFDDFEAGQWTTFEWSFRQAMPEAEFIEIDERHPIFRSFFIIENIDVPHPLVRVDPIYYGVFENNDPAGRMLALVNYNNDLAEYWEWSGEGIFPVDTTNDAWKLGVNYLIYGITH